MRLLWRRCIGVPLAIASAIGCLERQSAVAPSRVTQGSVAYRLTEGNAEHRLLLGHSLPLDDVSEATLKAHNAEDLIGQMTFMALSQPIGIELSDSSFQPLFPVGTPVPVEITQRLSTTHDAQHEMRILFCIGASQEAGKNRPIRTSTIEVDP
jgi:hypothetical protein